MVRGGSCLLQVSSKHTVFSNRMIPTVRTILIAMSLVASVRAADRPTLSPAARLGEYLFNDRRVSIDNLTSCADCHDPRQRFSDGLPVTVGHIQLVNGVRTGKSGIRRAPPLENVLHDGLEVKKLFLDLRAANGIEQATGPVENPDEMGPQTAQQMCNRLNRNVPGYGAMVRAAYEGQDSLTPDVFANAIVAYEKEFIAVDTPLWRYLEGDKSALTETEAHGAELMKKANCFACHAGPTFTTGNAANTGIEARFPKPGVLEDIGLQKTTGQRADRGKFKTPGLVNLRRGMAEGGTIYLTHKGDIRSVTAMVEHYWTAGFYLTADGRRVRDRNCDERLIDHSDPNDPENYWTENDRAAIVACLTHGTDAYDSKEFQAPDPLPSR